MLSLVALPASLLQGIFRRVHSTFGHGWGGDALLQWGLVHVQT